MERLNIDSDQELAVGRAVKQGQNYKVVKSDHFTCFLTFAGLPRIQERNKEDQVIWNLKREGGWDRYRTLSDQFSESLEKVVRNQDIDTEDKMKQFEKIHNKIKYKAFGKIRISGKIKVKEKKDTKSKDENKEMFAKLMVEEEEKIANLEIEEVKKKKLSKVGNIWEIRRKVIGGKKQKVQVSAILDPNSGELIVSKQKIKDVSLQYCKDTLSNHAPESDYKEEIRVKKDSFQKFLSESEGTGNFNISRETFDFIICKFQKSKKRNYDFLVKAGEGFKTAVFNFTRIMCDEEKFPESFKNTTLHMIFKGGQGRKEKLSENRFIHSKNWFPRTVEACVVEEGLREPLINCSSIYQIGGQPGHRAEELVFSLKSIIAKYRAQGKPIIIQSYDLAKFFDKENIEDAILTCINRGADLKACRLWYKLNQDTKIRVRTGAGMTNYAEAGALVGQGTIGGALVSQGVLDQGISGQFSPGGGDEMNFGSVPVAPFIFMDDIIHGAEGVEGARKANTKVDIAAKQLCLRLNQDKSVCTVMGSLKQRNFIRNTLNADPLMCGEFETKLKTKFKWLGQILSEGGLSESVAETVAAREGKIRGACLEIMAIVNDWRSRIEGGMETALLLWEVCCIPSLLHGAGTWMDISAASIKKLNQIQCWFLRLALQVGPGAARVSLLWDTACWDFQLRIYWEKILMVLHIRKLDKGSLAQLIYEEQKKKQWPGLSRETRDICTALKIPDCNETHIGKSEYLLLVREAIHKKNESMLRLLAVGKCQRIVGEDYGKKQYISKKNIFNVRQQYRARFGLEKFAGNYSNDRRFSSSEWLCRCLEAREDESHLTSGKCKVFGDIKERFGDLHDDENLVQFFQEVLTRRDEIDNL